MTKITIPSLIDHSNFVEINKIIRMLSGMDIKEALAFSKEGGEFEVKNEDWALEDRIKELVDDVLFEYDYLDLPSLIKKYGIENIRIKGKFLPIRQIAGVAYTSSSDDMIEAEAHLEWYHLDSKKNAEYKVRLVPEHDEFVLDQHDYYTSDLESLINRDAFDMWIVEAA